MLNLFVEVVVEVLGFPIPEGYPNGIDKGAVDVAPIISSGRQWVLGNKF